MKKWNKFINLNDARELSKQFCNNFKLQYCEIYYVDRIQDDSDTPIWKKGKDNTTALYSLADPPHILIVETVLNPIGLVIHELTHHLEWYDYENERDKICDDGPHGYFYQLAKKRVITWCKKNISNKADWNSPLKAIHTETAMKKFRL